MAAYALARIQYKPRFGNIMMFVVLRAGDDADTSYAGHSLVRSAMPWRWLCSCCWRVPSASISGARLSNGDILFWIISQRILPPIVVIIPIYMMFQSVGLLDTHLALIMSMRWPTCRSSSG
jgi:multiple sugar transport system permease protein